jgi:4-hydroxy-3-polyprenylbenzoate decarboxylase
LKLVIGITGSTGVIYGIRMLETLKKLNIETHLVLSEWGEKCISMETDFTPDYVKSLATNISDEKNMASSVSSGTHRIDGMIVAPCSMKTLARKLILMVRETPLSAIHLENMLKLARLGIVILPPVTEFYTKPKSIDDIVNHGVGKCLDQFDIEHNLYPRWGTL